MPAIGGPDARVLEALGEDEELLVSDRPAVGAWLIDQWLHVAAILACVVITWRAEEGVVAWLGAIAVTALLAVLVVQAVRVGWTRYVVTSIRAIRVSGVLRNDLEYLTWSKVTDVSVERSLGDRLTGTATIRIHTASERSSFKAMRDVGDPLEFARWITRMVNSRQRR